MPLFLIFVLVGVGVDLALELRKRRSFRHRIEGRLAAIRRQPLVRLLVVVRTNTPLRRQTILGRGALQA